MYVHAHGYLQRTMSYQFGLIGYFWRRGNKKSNALPDVMLLALDDSNLYLFKTRLFAKAEEIGRWHLHSYGAVAGESGAIQRGLTLSLDGRGDVELDVSIALANRPNSQVIEFVLGNARSSAGGSTAPAPAS
jgi:hypothetical protein